MKIDFITPFFYPVSGGEEKHQLSIAFELQKLGHKITVHTSNIDRHRNKLKRIDKINNIKIIRHNVWFRIGDFASFFPDVFRSIRKTDADIVHIHSYRHPHNLAVFFTKKPYIITPHWPNYPRGLRNKFLELFIPLFDLTIGRIILKKCRMIIALHEGEKSWLISKFRINQEKINIIPNGISEEDLKPINKNIFKKRYSIPENKILVLSIGRLHKSKGFDQVIDIAKFFPGVQFVIMGLSDINEKEIKNLAEKEKNIMLLTNKSDREKQHALASAEIVIIPSHYEGFGIVSLEAFSQKCAVISSDKGGLPYAIGNAGIIFKDNNLNDLKEKLKNLIANKKLRELLQKRGYERVKKYTWKSIASDLEHVYKEVIKKKI